MPNMSFLLTTFTLLLLWQLPIIISINKVENEESPVVNTTYGPVQGYVLANKQDGRPVNVFCGIPFARAPVNELRFEKPLEPKKWTGKVLDATKMGPSCFPYHKNEKWIPDTEYSEDCLFMNIVAPGWKPEEENGDKQHEKNLFPVLAYIHGGGFQSGTIRELSADIIAKKYVANGIVFVDFQYRLGALGFASTGADTFAGNYGLWDQIRALEFVRDNIERFGGDPKRITLLGFSAGSASVSALSLAPYSRSLFRQVIQMSGSLFTEWAVSNRVIGETEKLAKELGCSDHLESSEKLKKCLKGKSVHEMMDAVDRMGPARKEVNSLLFTPRLDADLFTEDPLSLLQNAPPKRTMMGTANLEGLSFTFKLNEKSVMDGITIPQDKWSKFGRSHFEKFIIKIVAPEKAFNNPQEAKTVQQKIIQFYLKEGGEGSHFFLRKYGEVITDLMFLVPCLFEARQKASMGWPTYLYLQDYFNKKYFPKHVPVQGSYHGVELPALLDLRHVPYLIEEYSEDDLAFEHVLLKSIANFVKQGDPSTSDFKWPPLDREHPLQYAVLKPQPEVGSSLAPVKLQFWQKLTEQHSFDIVRGIHKETLRSKDEL